MSTFRKKMVRIFDPSLMSGSDDVFRTRLGAGLVTDTDPKGRFGTFFVQETERGLASAQQKSQGQRPLPPLNGVDAHQRNHDPNSDPIIKNIANMQAHGVGDLADVQYQSEVAVPVLRYASRVYGDPEKIENDMHWKAFVYGGEYMGTEYRGVFSEKEYYDHWFEINLPFTTMEVEEIRDKFKQLPILDEINVTYEYNRFMKRYESWAQTRESERLIPNLYLLQSLSEADNLISKRKMLYEAYDRDDINFVSLDGMLKPGVWSDLLKDEREAEQEENFNIKQIRRGNRKRRRRMRRYLNRQVVHKRLTERTKQAIDLKYNNMIFDNRAVAGIFQQAAENKNLFPYYAKINFEAHPSKHFSKKFNYHDFTPKFMVALKETFGTDPTYIEPDEIECNAQMGERIKRWNINSVGTIDVRLADFGVLLNKARTNYINNKDDFCFVGRKNTEGRLTAYDSVGNYRFYNTNSATKALVEFLDFADNKQYLNEIKVPFDDDSFTGKYNEVMAYRIEKIGGPPTGDDNTQNVIQNFWFSNTRELHESSGESEDERDFNFFDSQVKYGKEYTYNVYAYVIVAGLRYQTSDERITRVIAELDTGEGKESKGATEELYCLEFYDPLTEQVKSKLYVGEGSGDKVVNNDFMTDSQIANVNKYLIDFNITVQPSIKIMEVPMTSKTIRILDAPPCKAQALPFAVEDDTNRIGYDIEYTEPDDRAFPPAISENDSVYKEEYMFSNNLLPNTMIDKASVSYPRYLQIFRTDVPPKRYEDFDGKLHKTVDLKIENSDHTLKEHIFYDKVDVNKNYYYVFRFVNEHQNPGRPSVVHVASLQDDGGFKYPVFEIYDFHQAMAKNKSEQTKISFKKLINIRPSIQQIVFNEDTYNLDMKSGEALREIEVGIAESSIWNRRFKFRLTSKKTGKKIDLNVTYNLLREHGRNKLTIDGVDEDGDGLDDAVTGASAGSRFRR